MSYNPYGGNPYGPPPSYGGFPGSNAAPGMAPPPGLGLGYQAAPSSSYADRYSGPPPGMSSAPGMAPPPGVQQSNNAQANRQSGLPPNFQAPANLPNINFSAPVIRLGTIGAKPGAPESGRKDSNTPSGGRQGLGMDRGFDQSRAAAREHMQSLVPPTSEEKLRTLFVHKIPDGVGGDEGIERILNAVGKLRRWDAATSVLSDGKGAKFGFAQYEDADSFSTAADLLQDTEVPLKRQSPAEAPSADDDKFEGVEMVKLQVTVDPNSLKYIESYKEGRGDDSGADSRTQAAKDALRHVIRDLVYPKTATNIDGEGDVAMGNSGENVEVVNIPLAQDDELADIPAEMREVVAAEIAAFRERSNKRDMERLKREEEMEEMERNRNGPSRPSRLDSPPPSNSNNIPVGPRGVPNAPSGPRGQNGTRTTSFVNGGISNTEFSINREDEDTDADDEELYQRELSKQNSEDEKMYLEAERKWVNRERSRAAALEREKERELQEEESLERRVQEQLEREKAWDDEREASRKNHLYYRDHAAWVKKRQIERADEQARDEADRKAEEDEQRREAADMEKARGIADSFLDQQAQEMEQRQQATVSAPAPFKLSLGAAAQRSQAQRAAPQRRTVAEVEGLLDDEEQDSTAKRQLIPIQFEPTTAADKMTEEEISKAVRALAQEIPSEKEGLWNWAVQWEYLDDAIIREKLRPFVEKKIVEYLGVQEELLVEVVEEHLRKHAKPSDLVEELVPALDDEAEDMVKKLWRMVIFFTESEKRGYPA
ncbi:RNA-binding protein rbm25 [Colletotrichum chrysophilum]|uniref:RNA-binding protein rbm25 n=1 Tax=Colletotrichum chrysophilum TaxID=1836956 RepID=A0AAD9ABI0_9PEZI|nr:RNA-binding protein rbm25 [Colletotrichum chrysophilum]